MHLISGPQFCHSCQYCSWRVVQRPSTLKLATLFHLSKVPLDHSWKLTGRGTDHNFAESHIGRGTATDTNHQTDFNGWKSCDHLGHQCRCGVVAYHAARQASYDNIMLAD